MFKFKEYREKAGLTQKEAASAFGVSIQSVSNWETGTRRPSLEQLCAIADHYNVSTDQLLGRQKLDVLVVNADPPPKTEGLVDVVFSAGTKATPDSLEKQIRSIMLDELKKRGL